MDLVSYEQLYLFVSSGSISDGQLHRATELLLSDKLPCLNFLTSDA